MDDKLDGLSMNIEHMERDKLKSIFPECFAEGKLDIDKLLSLCGEYISNDFEKYKFEWKGKSECLQLAQKRSTGTLRPCPEESVNWDTTQNLYIEGDNLEVLKLLQTAYYRKIKMIYIDPPYNTGNDFVYEDNFADPIQRYKEVTQQTTKSNPETMGRYHTNWLNMIYPRLRLAANLLKDDGVIFISIDDNEVHNLRKVCDEVFGEENFAGLFPWRKRTAKSDVPFGISQDYEWILCYSKSDEFIACLEGGSRKYFETEDFPDKPWRIHDLTKQTSASERPNSYFTMINPKDGKEYPADSNRTWAITEDTFKKYIKDNRIVFPGDYSFLNISKPAFRYFKEDDMVKAGDKFGFIPVSTKLPNEIGMTQDGTKEITDIFGNKAFGFPKPIALIKYLIKTATDTITKDNDLVLDFFSGSATTAHAVMQLNAEDGGSRHFILVQLPEICNEKSEAYKAGYKNICEIGKERIRRAGSKLKNTLEKSGGDFRYLAKNIQDAPQQTFFSEDGKKAFTVPIIPARWGAANEDESNKKMANLLDIGFKVFKLDTSNLKTWDSTPIADDNLLTLYDRMNGMINRVKTDRTDIDMVCEIMLKLGVPLTDSLTKVDIGGKAAYKVGDDCLLLICLAENVLPEDVEKMTECAPAKIIIARDCFANDTAMANAHYILQDKSIELKLV